MNTKPPANKEPRAIDLAMIDSSLLKQRLAHEIEGRRTERFYWVFALIIVLDVIVFPQLGWVLFWIFLLQVIFLIGLARWLHIDPVVVLLQRLFDRHLAVGAKKDHDEASPS